MDKISLAGIAIGLLAIIGGQFLEGGLAGSLVQPTALLIVLGGTLGAVLLQSPIHVFRRGMKMVKWVWVPPVIEQKRLIDQIMNWSQGVALSPFEPANGGFTVDWSPVFRERIAGQPLKATAITHGRRTVRGEAVVARYGIEGGAIYALSADLRAAVAAEGSTAIEIDLRPDLSVAQLAARLDRPRGGQSAATFLRKAANLSPLEINLLRETHGIALPADLTGAIKRAPLRLTGLQGIARAISTAGGVRLDAVDQQLMLKARPGVYVAGEMLDWEAPTGGYLLQACFATGAAAARAILARPPGGE